MTYKSGIESIDAGISKGSNTVYNTQGQRIAQPQRGVHIVRLPDGTSQKVLVT